MKWKNSVGKKIILPSVSSFNQNFRESMYASRHKNENTDKINVDVKKSTGKKCTLCWKILHQKCERKFCGIN